LTRLDEIVSVRIDRSLSVRCGIGSVADEGVARRETESQDVTDGGSVLVESGSSSSRSERDGLGSIGERDERFEVGTVDEIGSANDTESWITTSEAHTSGRSRGNAAVGRDRRSEGDIGRD
jgi:hypothetical protein